MKRIFLLLSIFSMGMMTKAQLSYDDFEGGDAEYLFNKRSTTVKLGIGQPLQDNQLSATYPNAKISSGTPTYTLSFENGWFNLGKGFVVGYLGAFGYQQITLVSKFPKDSFEYFSPYKSNIISGHLGISLHKSFNKNIEIYGNAVNIFDVHISEEVPDNTKIFNIRPAFGVRYRIYKNLSIFAEGGIGQENYRAGIAFF